LLFRFARKLAAGHRVITLISSTGGGRDVGRRAPNGKVAGELCDLVVVTDEDPYDEDPHVIIDQVAEGVRAAGKVEGQNFWRVLNRRDGIRKAVELAQPGDVVLLTAKGAEQKMCVAGGKKIPWDDRKFVRDFLK
jgi:UDP-N-acetylmuramoyl-L-alanyl-D-glutamate--2,6-diaminopimelate ligase